jgi:hypothetical protein
MPFIEVTEEQNELLCGLAEQKNISVGNFLTKIIEVIGGSLRISKYIQEENVSIEENLQIEEQKKILISLVSEMSEFVQKESTPHNNILDERIVKLFILRLILMIKTLFFI